MFDFNSSSGLTDRINAFVDAAIEADAVLEPPRNYLGASVVGHECERYVQFHYIAAQGRLKLSPFPARIHRIFDRGNVYEQKCRGWLRRAGFVFNDAGVWPNRFEAHIGQFRGHVDDVLLSWSRPEACPVHLPALWEHKCLKDKKWKALVKDKLKKFSPTYFAQVQIYMHFTKLERCLFSATNADTMEIHHEMVPYNAEVVAQYLARVQHVIDCFNAGEFVPRVTTDRNLYICKYCDFKAECWK